MNAARDWLSRFLEIVPVSGALDLRCLLGAPWRIDFATSASGEIPYHVVLSGVAILEESDGGPRQQLVPGDIVLFPHGSAHVLHDGSDKVPLLARNRQTLSVTFHENDGPGDRLDMICGRFLLPPAHDRLIRTYLPHRLIVHTAGNAPGDRLPSGPLVAKLVSLMRAESSAEGLGGIAMLNALSTALFALVLRLASEIHGASDGLLALAANPRLAPALAALFDDLAHAWTLPELAKRCNMSRATFIRHFQKSLGRSVSDLLTDIRMTVSANALRTSELSTSAVAELAGYQSEAAFQRVFKQKMGVTPARWRKSARTA